MQTSQLVDLLAEQTAILTKMFTEKNFGEQYERHKLFLKAIQTEIDVRRNDQSTNITTPPDFS